MVELFLARVPCYNVDTKSVGSCALQKCAEFVVSCYTIKTDTYYVLTVSLAPSTINGKFMPLDCLTSGIFLQEKKVLAMSEMVVESCLV